MTETPDIEEILAAAAELDLVIPAECLSGVAENARLIAEHAARVEQAR